MDESLKIALVLVLTSTWHGLPCISQSNYSCYLSQQMLMKLLQFEIAALYVAVSVVNATYDVTEVLWVILIILWITMMV